MTDVIVSDSKTCAKCKQVKPLSEFYPRSRQPQYRVSECKDCMRERSKHPIHLPEGETRVETEALTILELAKQGILARPGRDLNIKFCDVVAFGHVYIEVKSSHQRKDGTYVFALTERQKQDGVRGDVVVLICRTDHGDTFHVFPVNHEIFYNEDERKRFVVYTPNPKHRKDTRRAKLIVPLTTQLMREHQDGWALVMDVLKRKIAAAKGEKAA